MPELITELPFHNLIGHYGAGYTFGRETGSNLDQRERLGCEDGVPPVTLRLLAQFFEPVGGHALARMPRVGFALPANEIHRSGLRRRHR